MHSRLTLHEELVAILGSRYVYFQPPESVKMNYPCIVYERRDIDNMHADDMPYLQPVRYRVIVIDRDPDSQIVVKMSQFKTANYLNHYVANELNHDTFEIFY